MKTLQSIAKITKEMANNLPPEDFPTLADAVLHFLDQQGMHSQKILFLRILEKTLAEESSITALRLVTPSGRAGKHAAAIASIVEKTLKKPANIEESAHPDLLGGALLTYENERFDGTLRGALSTLQQHLLSPLL